MTKPLSSQLFYAKKNIYILIKYLTQNEICPINEHLDFGGQFDWDILRLPQGMNVLTAESPHHDSTDNSTNMVHG
jgi:hypothetical protein